MEILRDIIVFDAPDLAVESAFWARLLGGTVDGDEDDWHTVFVDGRPRIGVQLAPGLIRSDWPAGTVPQQLHFDLYVADIRSAHDEALAAGAVLLQDADADTPDGFRVYADPAGHPFCLCWG